MGDGSGLIELAGGEKALRQDDLIQLVDEPKLAPLTPGKGAWVALANLRGEVIPVADLGLVVGGDPTEGPVMVAIKASRGTFGLLIEGVERTVEGPDAGETPDEALSDDPNWLLPAPHGQSRVIDPVLLLEDPQLLMQR